MRHKARNAPLSDSLDKIYAAKAIDLWSPSHRSCQTLALTWPIKNKITCRTLGQKHSNCRWGDQSVKCFGKRARWFADFALKLFALVWFLFLVFGQFANFVHFLCAFVLYFYGDLQLCNLIRVSRNDLNKSIRF